MNIIEKGVKHAVEEAAMNSKIDGAILEISFINNYTKNFEFKKLEDINYKGNKLSDFIDSILEKNKELEKRIDQLEDTIVKLADFIDKQRFL